MLTDNEARALVTELQAYIREQDAELNGLRATLAALDVEITSLRETVRFLNDALRVLEAKL
jgi:prefoldin subunit 5